MPETKEELTLEITRLEQWCADMDNMLGSDGTVPENMWAVYNRQFTQGLDRLSDLKTRAKENGWAELYG